MRYLSCRNDTFIGRKVCRTADNPVLKPSAFFIPLYLYKAFLFHGRKDQTPARVGRPSRNGAGHRHERIHRTYGGRKRESHCRAALRQGPRSVRGEDQEPSRSPFARGVSGRRSAGRHQGGRSRTASRTQAADHHGRHRQGDRRGLGQGWGRQIHRHGQSGRRSAEHGIPRGNPRRRHLRTFAAQDVRRGRICPRSHCRGGCGPHRPGRVDGHPADVDRLLHQTHRRPAVARGHGRQRPEADDPPDPVGNARLPAGGPASRHGRRASFDYRRVEDRRRGDRLDSPADRRGRRRARCGDVPQ